MARSIPRRELRRAEAGQRQTRLQQIEAPFEPLAFDARVARSYGQVEPS